MANNQTAARRAIRALLKPVVRILLRCGISYAQFSALAKQVYVQVATEDYGLRGRPTNISRVALLTGLTRRDVRKQREMLGERDSGPVGRVSNVARVLHYWHSDSTYTDANGAPARLAVESGEKSFEALYRAYGGGDVPWTAALKELVSSGTVVRHDDDTVEARRNYFMPAESDPVAIERAGEVLADLGETIAHNLDAGRDGTTRFEGRATTRHLSRASLPAYRQFLERQGQAFLEKIDDWLSDHESDGSTTTRIGVGVYQVETDDDKEPKA